MLVRCLSSEEGAGAGRDGLQGTVLTVSVRGLALFPKLLKCINNVHVSGISVLKQKENQGIRGAGSFYVMLAIRLESPMALCHFTSALHEQLVLLGVTRSPQL